MKYGELIKYNKNIYIGRYVYKYNMFPVIIVDLFIEDNKIIFKEEIITYELGELVLWLMQIKQNAN